MSRFYYCKRKVKCPFYLGERYTCIYCQGSLSDKVQFIFDTAEKKQAYKQKYCNVEKSSCMHRICLNAMKGKKDG